MKGRPAPVREKGRSLALVDQQEGERKKKERLSQEKTNGNRPKAIREAPERREWKMGRRRENGREEDATRQELGRERERRVEMGLSIYSADGINLGGVEAVAGLARVARRPTSDVSETFVDVRR